MFNQCRRCEAALPHKHRSEYCSAECRTKADYEDFKVLNPVAAGIRTSTVGAIGELLAAADLMQRGLFVYRALDPSAPCDLVALHGKRALLVEVKTGYRRRQGGTFSIPLRPSQHCDVLAIVYKDGVVEYRPTLESVLEVVASA